MKKHIYLIGFMGTGKTTVSRRLKNLMNVKEIDMDATIVEENSMSIPEMFQQFGEEYFRGKETRLLQRLALKSPAIISCGGGTVLREENVAAMKESGTIVLLTATPETVYERVKNGRERPLLKGRMDVESIREFMEQRREIYEKVCDYIVSTDGKTPEEIAREIMHLQ